MPPAGQSEPILDRITRRTVMDPSSECWVWQGQTVAGGYGRMTVGSRADGTRRQVLAHRAAYEAARGPIPGGLTIDHVVCDNPPCCNPDHLEPATMKVNTLRSATARTALNARKERCPKCDGPFTQTQRGRVCRPCRLAYFRRYNATRR